MSGTGESTFEFTARVIGSLVLFLGAMALLFAASVGWWWIARRTGWWLYGVLSLAWFAITSAIKAAVRKYRDLRRKAR